MWQIIVRRKLVIILSSIVIVVAILIICLTVAPVYETVSRIKIKRVDESQAVISSVPTNFGSLDYIAPKAAITQAEVVKSAKVVKPVIRKLNLIERWTIIDTIKSFIPFFEIEEKTYSRVDNLVDASIVGWFLQRRNIIVESVMDSDIVEIYAYSDNLEEAKNMANEVVNSYIHFNETHKTTQGEISVEVMENELQHVQKRLEEDKSALQAFQEEEVFIDFDNQSKAIADETQRLEKELYDVRRNLKIIEESIKAIEKELNRQPEYIISTRNTRANPLIDNLKEDISEIKTKLAGTSLELRPEHIEYQILESQIKLLETTLREEPDVVFNSEESTINKIREELNKRYSDKKIEYQELKSKEKTVSEDILAYKNMLTSLLKKKNRSENFELAVMIAEKDFTKLSENLSAGKLAESSSVTNVSIITKAPIPDKDDPYYPDLVLYTLVALFAGPFAGFGLALIVDYVDDSLKNRNEVEENLKLPILASFPSLKRKNAQSLDPRKFRVPFSGPLVELRYNLEKRNIDNDEKMVIAVTSAVVGEGKTTIASALACALVQNGQRVVILDLNFSAPSIHKIFQLSPTHGIRAVLTGKVAVEEAIFSTDFFNLMIIPCESTAPEVYDSFDFTKLSNLINFLANSYDVVLIDTPAVGSEPIASIIASYSDSSIFVVMPGKTSNSQARGAKEKLIGLGVKLSGVVLNRYESQVTYNTQFGSEQ